MKFLAEHATPFGLGIIAAKLGVGIGILWIFPIYYLIIFPILALFSLVTIPEDKK